MAMSIRSRGIDLGSLRKNTQIQLTNPRAYLALKTCDLAFPKSLSISRRE